MEKIIETAEQVVQRAKFMKICMDALDLQNKRLQETINRMASEQAMMLKEKERSDYEIGIMKEELKKYQNCCGKEEENG